MYIRHKGFKDVCIDATFLENKKFYARWINMGYTKSWYLPSKTEIHEIVDRKEWEKCINPTQVQCLRYAQWAPL